LHRAACDDDRDAIQALLEARANPDSQNRDGQTPLHYRVASDHLDATKKLLKAGANPHILDKHGHTPFFYAHRSITRNPLLSRARICRAFASWGAEAPPHLEKSYARYQTYIKSEKERCVLTAFMRAVKMHPLRFSIVPIVYCIVYQAFDKDQIDKRVPKGLLQTPPKVAKSETQEEREEVVIQSMGALLLEQRRNNLNLFPIFQRPF